jgi:hypothetical protein
VTPLLEARRRLTLALVGLGAIEVRLDGRESKTHAPRLLVTIGSAQPRLPIRAAFYYPWFPESWKQRGIAPFTRYTPSLGLYNSSSTRVIRAHIQALLYGRFDAGIVSWWGPGTNSDARFAKLLAMTRSLGVALRWAIYYEPEGQRDPSVEQLHSDLTYVRNRYGADPAYLRIGGRLVVFVYGDARDSCSTANRWKRADTIGVYVVLKVVAGYRTCQSQPDGWHQYAPAKPEDSQLPWAFTISPGFYHATDATQRLPRDIVRWRKSVRDMIASGATFQLVTTFNEWGEGTAVESAKEWRSASGYGAYLDVLHGAGRAGPPRVQHPLSPLRHALRRWEPILSSPLLEISPATPDQERQRGERNLSVVPREGDVRSRHEGGSDGRPDAR